ncbi:MAG: MltA domain-containing protein [Tatlockia sp.]|nr:MltA domain-containing protein [Tatlockia sp.]
MIRIIIYLIIGFVCPTSSLRLTLVEGTNSKLLPSSLPVIVLVKTESKSVTKIKPEAKLNLKSVAKIKKVSHEKPQKITINQVALKKIPFEELPGWNETDIKNSLIAFQNSCKIFLKQDPSHKVGSRYINIQAKDWQPACREAAAIDAVSEDGAKEFFKKWFHPVEFTQRKPVEGLFTGYYMPQLKGSLTRTKEYNTPIYSMPSDLHWPSSKRAYFTREQIDSGALKKKAAVIAWINSPVERSLLETEGAGIINLTSGKNLYLGYAGENGAHYTSLSSVLIKKGLMTPSNASKTALIQYFKRHPNNVNAFLHKNKSFVFFEDLKQPEALGALDMTLTPGYSLAIDKKWIPLGSPLWLTTKKPLENSEKMNNFNRLVIAQDTGGAIRGLMRGDIYWGSGKKAIFLGEHMKNKGRFWLLLPKHIFEKLLRIG